MSNDNPNYDEIYEIKDLYKSIKRNFSAFLKFIILSSAISLLYAFTKAKTWEGEFQIVLEDKSENNLFSNLNKAPKILTDRLTSKTSNINTEVGILKSASTLMPVFENYKSEKINKNINLEKMIFKKWLNKHLKIKLTDETKILNIKFMDNDKEMIIPVLNNISNQYQTYSNKSRLRNIQLTSNYLENQINLYKKQSFNSLKKVQEYALEQDLIFYYLGQENINKINNKNNKSMSLQESNLLLPNIEIENTRVKAANEIRKINLQLQKIEELIDYKELQYIGSTIPALVDEGLPKSLSDIEAELIEARTKYSNKDLVITNLIKKRKLAIDLLKNRTIKYLEAQKLNAEAVMKASMRPKGTLLKYKELLRRAARDESTLIDLENQYRFIKLEEARREDPWELITDPTLNQYPISPNKKRILLLGLIIGVTSGVLYSLLKDKSSNIIYNLSTLKKITKCNTILNLEKYDEINWKTLINSLILKNDFRNKRIGFQTIGSIEKIKLKVFEKLLSETDLKENYSISEGINNLENCDLFIIIANLGSANLRDLKRITEITELQNKKIMCCFLI